MQQKHSKVRRTPLAEACLFLILNQVSTNAVWGRTLSPNKSPVTTADTTAELGCTPWHWAIACKCHLIRPAADRRCVFLRCRNHAVTMAHRSGGCHAPWAVFLPYRFNSSQGFFLNLIDKSLSHRHSCRAVAGKHHSDFRREKTRKEAALDAYPFRVFQNSRLFNFYRL